MEREVAARLGDIVASDRIEAAEEKDLDGLFPDAENEARVITVYHPLKVWPPQWKQHHFRSRRGVTAPLTESSL